MANRYTYLFSNNTKKLNNQLSNMQEILTATNNLSLSEISVPVTIKVSYNAEFRRMPFHVTKNNNNWSALRAQIATLFDLVDSTLQDIPSHIVFKYKDDEDELVNISTEDEFLMALSISQQISRQKPLIKLFVVDTTLNNSSNYQVEYKIKKIPIEERKGFEENLRVLKEFGFSDERLNLNVMRRFYFSEKDFSLVVDHLCEKSKKSKNKKDRRQQLEAKREERKKIREERKRKREEKKKEKQAKKKEYNLNKKIKKDKIAKQDKDEEEETEEKTERKYEKKKEGFGLHENIETLNWEEITDLYLDGNNMLYICSFLRELVLRRRRGQNNNVVEQLLGQIAKEFGKAKMLKKVVMIFDSTRLKIEENDFGFEYILCSARPEYKTSDDRLVDWAKENEESNNNNNSIYVTSDRELCRRLKETGVRIIAPKRWLIFAANTISGQEIKSDVELDLWLNEKLNSLEL